MCVCVFVCECVCNYAYVFYFNFVFYFILVGNNQRRRVLHNNYERQSNETDLLLSTATPSPHNSNGNSSRHTPAHTHRHTHASRLARRTFELAQFRAGNKICKNVHKGNVNNSTGHRQSERGGRRGRGLSDQVGMVANTHVH